MILPAATYLILGFIDKQNQILKKTPQSGNLLMVRLDNGNNVVLEWTGSKKETNLEDITRYLKKKQDSVFREKNIILVSSELEMDEDHALFLEKEKERLKDSGKDLKEVLKEVKDITKKMATDIVYSRGYIGSGSIVRSAVSMPKNKATYTFKDQEYKKLFSRCILFDTSDQPITTGLYYMSTTANNIPVEITEARNKDKESLNFWTAKLSPLANKDHIDYLIEHILRTARKQISENKEAHLGRISVNFNTIKACTNQELKNVLNKLKEITFKKGVKTLDTVVAWSKEIKELKEILIKDPSLLQFTDIQINVNLNKSDIETLTVSKNTPFKDFGKNFARLNMSKDSPEIKEMVENNVSAKIKEGTFVTTYFFPAPVVDIMASDSWGFMTNNLSDQTTCPTITNAYASSKDEVE